MRARAPSARQEELAWDWSLCRTAWDPDVEFWAEPELENGNLKDAEEWDQCTDWACWRGVQDGAKAPRPVRLTVKDVRPATEDEIQHEHAHGADGLEVLDEDDDEGDEEPSGPTLH